MLDSAGSTLVEWGRQQQQQHNNDVGDNDDVDDSDKITHGDVIFSFVSYRVWNNVKCFDLCFINISILKTFVYVCFLKRRFGMLTIGCIGFSYEIQMNFACCYHIISRFR